MFRTRAENSFGISVAATKRCDRQREQRDEARAGAHSRNAHNEAEHDLDRGDDNEAAAIPCIITKLLYPTKNATF